MLTERGVVKIGIEIEIPAWDKARTYVDVVDDLLERDYMAGGRENWTTIHTYGCECEFGCGIVRAGDVIVPPLVSATYDASLPETGGEFVVSPIVMVDGISPIREIWDIVTKDAVWTDTLHDRRGNGYCSPSIHLHCSVTQPGKATAYAGPTDRLLSDDVLHALYLFSPELLLMADITDVRRGLRFRQLLRMAEQNGHHGFVHIRSARPNYLHIEWRIFEAAYTSFEYVEAAAYLAGVLTRALGDPVQRNRLFAAGFTHSFDNDTLMLAVHAENVDAVLRMVSLERFETLRNTTLSLIDDDPRGYDTLAWMFDQAARKLTNAR